MSKDRKLSDDELADVTGAGGQLQDTQLNDDQTQGFGGTSSAPSIAPTGRSLSFESPPTWIAPESSLGWPYSSPWNTPT